MARGYRHLTYEQRCQLYALKRRGDSHSSIAEELGIHRSTVYREIARNTGGRGYRFKQAHQRATDRRQKASGTPTKMTEETISAIESKLRLQWSPEQISGWLKRDGHAQHVSHETIYKYVWRDKRRGGFLYKHLRHNGKKYNKRRSGKAGRGCIPNRRDIDERPSIVDEKSRLGDWEADTIVGKNQQGAIVSVVERTSKLTKLVKICRRTACEVETALLGALTPLQECVLTLTADNGKEFANHQGIARELNSDFFFAKPYHAWQRGLNEHTNGLIRQYFPKGTAFDDITQEEITEVEALLNNRPRKVLQFSTPIEVFEELSRRSTNVALRN